MTEFAQNMTAIAGVLLGAASVIKAATMCVKAFKRSVTINVDPSAWRRIDWRGWLLVMRVGFLLFAMLFGLYQLRQLSFSTAPLTTGDAANLVLYTLFIVMGFYPPESFNQR
jgi:hypothetical protein